MKELIKITNEENFITERGTILSTNLVTIINEFRKVESETNEEKRFIELKHKDFTKTIRKEDETLKTLGLDGGWNFSPTSYKDIQGKIQPCYELNRDGMIIMLNSESTIVRYYTMEYIKRLEEKLKQVTKEVKHYEKKLYDYSTSPLLMDNIPGDSLVLNFLNNSTRKETEAIINKTGIKATFFAKQLNISDSNMCSWRKNEINFNEDKINNLLKVLDTIKGVLLLE